MMLAGSDEKVRVMYPNSVLLRILQNEVTWQHNMNDK